MTNINYSFISKSKTLSAQAQLHNWLNNQHFSHFLTIRPPVQNYTDDLNSARKTLHYITTTFEKYLCGRHWNRNPVNFVGFIEYGKTHTCHYHLNLWAQNYTTEQIETAIELTKQHCKIPSNSMYLEKIEQTPEKVNSYITKEILADNLGHIDNNRFIFSYELFDIKCNPHTR